MRRSAIWGKPSARPHQAGDVWLWVAFDPETKLISSWRVGDQTLETARDFMADLKERLTHIVSS